MEPTEPLGIAPKQCNTVGGVSTRDQINKYSLKIYEIHRSRIVSNCQSIRLLCFSDKEAEVMRSSSWLYQYTAQSKFTYGLCPSAQSQQLPIGGNPYSNQDYGARSSGLIPHEADESSPSYSSHDDPLQRHHHHNPQATQQHRHCSDGRSESGDYAGGPAGNGGKTGHGQSYDEIEPVDMSINSTEHENTRTLYQLTHPMTYSPKHHHEQHQQQQHQQQQDKGGISPIPSYRGKSSIIHYSHGGHYSASESPAQKYNIIDLDCGYGGAGESCSESRIMTTVHAAQKRNHHHHHHHHHHQHHQQQQQHMNIKQQSSSVSLMEGNETSIEHHWSSSSPPIWSDALQRVPDVVHQDLSPYITTPTTPADTPDSELHSEVPVFNFEWPSGEQHVPISKVIVCRNNASGGHQEGRKIGQAQDDNSAAPMTLQLPKRKNHADSTKDYEK